MAAGAAGLWADSASSSSAARGLDAATKSQHARTADSASHGGRPAPGSAESRQANHSQVGSGRGSASRRSASHGGASKAAKRTLSHTPSASGTAGIGRAAGAVTPAKPYLFYDSLTPGAIPPDQIVATYAGAVPVSEVAGRKHVLWIDVTGTNYAAAILDVEPGNATPSAAASWALHKLTAEPHAVAIIYTMISEWPAVQAAVATMPAPMRAQIRWWIADPTGVAHLVPGSDATQWYWGQGYDISTATPRF